MFEKLEECPSCGHPKFTNHSICTDHSISGESFALVQCSKCELVFTNPRPRQDNIGKYYESEKYISHANKSNSLVDLAYKFVRNYTLRKKRKLLNSFNPDEKTLLDYGCGTGHFLEFMSKSNWQIQGVEPNEQARNLANKKTGNQVTSDLVNLSQKFNIITAWHVIEHVHELKETLKALRKRLTDDGHLLIAVPNCNSHDAKHYKENWAAYDVPRHLYHFTQSSFEKLVAKRKLKIKETIPMKFDAYYVSLLSEKYVHGTDKYLSALKTARRSNSAAKQNGEYSSLIYVLTK